MKESEYNEIDRLLRNLAGRSLPDGQAGADLSGGGAHLDADELSAYAEGALPPSTRARYTSHLADCDDCRRIVTQLSLVTGSVIKEGKVGHEPAVSHWRQILATLFASAVLRYAMPALALVIVGTFAFLGWRQQREVSLVAVNKQAEVPGSPHSTGDVASENSRASNAPSEQKQKTARSQSSPAATFSDKVTAVDKKAEAESGSSAGGSSKEKDAPKKDEDAPKNETMPVAQPSYAPEVAAAPAPKPATATVAKSSAKVGEDRIESRDSVVVVAGRKEPDKSGAGRAMTVNGTAPQSRAREKTKALDDTRADADRQAEEESESRTVNGRRFQRRHGAWVDTAYNSSTATTNVARGSEQYRALIADEPGIDVIAKQLSGEIILVWKGHAYRIR